MHSDDDYTEEDHRAAAGAVGEDAETWQDYHSEFLVAAWHRLLDHVASMGVYVLDRAAFHDFAHFCFQHSSGRKPPC